MEEEEIQVPRAQAPPPREKGFSFRGSKVKAAPPEYKIPPPTFEPAALKPGPITSGLKASVGEEKVAARPSIARGMFSTAATNAPAAPSLKPKTAARSIAAKPTEEPTSAFVTAPKRTVVKEPEPALSTAFVDMLETLEDSDLKEMGTLIKKEESRDLYSSAVPEAYVPQTRRGFSDFIKMTFRTFELPEGAITIPEGEKYFPYQKFVRDYMRMEAPYRGILVYHGLGSGKTCTSIATAEALFASAHKKIIVMANYSLKKNFFNEISKCGFRHFQLNNYWTPLNPKEESTVLFANQILGLSPQYIKRANQIWVPDFRKSPAEANYNELDDTARQEIRKQILSILEWDPVKNPTGRIRFIAYNGISAKKLVQMACDPSEDKFFDNAVIVIDEVHNLIRNIQGKIEPFFKNIPGKKRSARMIQVEPTVPSPRWKPTVCDPEKKIYNRGYLFYRMLIEARNSKIVGLSGTPLINFPEELGILSNVLHGYIQILKGVIQQSGPGLNTLIEDIGHRNPYIDFIKAVINKDGGGYIVTMSLIPAGMRKLDNEKGVMRIPPEEPMPTFEEIVKGIEESFRGANLPFRGPITYTSEPLLPPFGDDFGEYFMDSNGITNKLMLMTRLSGLISYYKGSQLELMPEVIKDEVVRVPFSLYAMKAYTIRRSAEVEREAQKKDEGTMDATWAKMYQLGDTKASNNYKMGSRQACNFAFPGSVVRPAAASKNEEKEEAAEGFATIDSGVADEENEAAAEVTREELEFEFPAIGDEDAAAAAEAAAEEEELLKETGLFDEEEGGAEVQEVQEGGAEEEEVWDSGDLEQGVDLEGEEGEDSLVDALMGGGKTKKTKGVAEQLVEGIVDATVGLPKEKKEKKIVRFEEKKESAGAEAAEVEEPDESEKERIEFSNDLENVYQVFSFYAETPFEVDEKEYPTLEHFYQSQKYVGVDDAYAELVRKASSPRKARLLGRDKAHPERADFRKNKEAILMRGLEAKFKQNEEIEALLMISGDAEIFDMNEKDALWGVGPTGDGENRLGKLIMELRERIRLEEKREAEVEEAMKKAEELLKPAPTKKTVVRQIKPKGVTAAAEMPDGGLKLEDCKAGRKPGEKYKDACARAKRCLGTVAREALRLGAPEGLDMHSPKYAAMLRRIEEAPGSSLVYSQFLDMEGIGIFRVAMDVNGYAPIEIIQVGNTFAFSKRTEESFRLGPGKQPRYITFSGGEDPKVRSLALDLFNAKFSELTESMIKVLTEAGYTDNKVGQICRVFCITSAGAEGLSLKNVRAVHIMEPYWNEVRLRQVKGRAIRIGSHLDLPEDQRNVSIYTYISVFPEESQRSQAGEFTIDEAILSHDSVPREKIETMGIPVPPGVNTYTLTTDEMIYVISERKRKFIEELEKLMKMAAVDCTLNQEQNMEGDDDYQCFVIRGKAGDFLYHPELKEDKAEAGKLVEKGALQTQAAQKVLPTLAPIVPAAVPGKSLLPSVRTILPTAPGGIATAPKSKVEKRTLAAAPVTTKPDAALKAAEARAAALEEVKQKELAAKEKKTAKKIAAAAATEAAASPVDPLEENLRAFYKEVKAPILKIAQVGTIAKKYKAGIWDALKAKGEYPEEIIEKYRTAYEAAVAGKS